MDIELIKAYSYRQAFVQDISVRLPRAVVRDLEIELNKQNGTRIDNHTTFIFDVEYETQHVTFSDRLAYFGSCVEVKRW